MGNYATAEMLNKLVEAAYQVENRSDGGRADRILTNGYEIVTKGDRSDLPQIGAQMMIADSFISEIGIRPTVCIERALIESCEFYRDYFRSRICNEVTAWGGEQ
jgi:hypothetical protein